jgi:hypothetical protein
MLSVMFNSCPIINNARLTNDNSKYAILVGFVIGIILGSVGTCTTGALGSSLTPSNPLLKQQRQHQPQQLESHNLSSTQASTGGTINIQPSGNAYAAASISSAFTFGSQNLYFFYYNRTTGKGIAGAPVSIKDCLVPGKADNDGHQLYDMRSDACASSTTTPPRPFATLIYQGTEYHNTNQNPLQATTDSNGYVYLTNVPPTSGTGGVGIAGEDSITATFPPNTTPPTFTITESDKVTGLSEMANSNPSPCPTPGTLYPPIASHAQYGFQSQANHGCQFFGTSNTNIALAGIANTYNSRQQACINYISTHSTNPPIKSNPCDILWEPTAGNIQNITVDLSKSPTPGVIPMWVTAMASNWGGLLDIGPGGCPAGQTCTFWNPPHKTHNDGKNVDITFNHLSGGTNADPHIKMLRYIIVYKTPNWNGNPANEPPGWGLPSEGGDMSKTANHFHIVFSS